MYWKEIPIQVQGEDEQGTTSVLLEERFQQAADSISMMDGSAGSDKYLMGWEWGESIEIDGVERYIPKKPIFDEGDGVKLVNISRKTQAPSRIFQ